MKESEPCPQVRDHISSSLLLPFFFLFALDRRHGALNIPRLFLSLGCQTSFRPGTFSCRSSLSSIIASLSADPLSLQ